MRETRQLLAAYILLGALKLSRLLGGRDGHRSLDHAFAQGAAQAFRNEGWDIVKFDPTPEPAERPLVAERFPV